MLMTYLINKISFKGLFGISDGFLFKSLNDVII